MKDDKFQELVHLYLDGEIQPRDFRRLTKQLSRNPARRAYFLQHCRLQRALSIALRKNQSQTLPTEDQIYKRITRRKVRRSRLPDWIGATATLLLITFLALPPAWVNSWLPGNLGDYTGEVRGGLELAMKDNLQHIQKVLPLAVAQDAVSSEEVNIEAEAVADAAMALETQDWSVDPWDENLGGQPWWEFRHPGLEWLSRVVEEDAFSGLTARELRVAPFRANSIR